MSSTRRPLVPVAEEDILILTRARVLRILLSSAVMAAGTLAVLVWAPGPDAALGVATISETMAFATTTGLTAGQWLEWAATASSVLAVGEIVTLVLRRTAQAKGSFASGAHDVAVRTPEP